MERMSLAVLIDADNISYELIGEIFRRLGALGDLTIRRAYGMVNCFANPKGWRQATREYGILARPQVSNVSGKNVADIALVIDAMEILFRNPCEGICIVSQDSDFTALAAKIRESGKAVYCVGGAKTPESFRAACTDFILLRAVGKTPSNKVSGQTNVKREYRCPRCGVPMVETRTKSNKTCRHCEKCGGMSIRLDALKKNVPEECLKQIKTEAAAHSNAGCVCPNCGGTMTLLKVASGKKEVEIDVCASCSAVWYDRDEFEQLLPNDGALVATVSAGKSYRRELVISLSSDLRSGRLKVGDVGALKSVLKKVYHTPNPDVDPIISTLACQKVVKLSKTGKIDVIDARDGLI